MAELSTNEKINLSLKEVLGVQGTWNPNAPNGLDWSQEQIAFKSFVLNSDIFIDTVPQAATPADAIAAALANPMIIEARTIKLSPVPGTNARAWIAYKTYNNPNSGVYDNWLMPQLFGRGYAMRLFQDNGASSDSLPLSGAPGNEISTSEGAWVVQYKNSMILLGDAYTASAMAWKTPIWATVYRYIGRQGVSGATAGVGLEDAYRNGHSINADAGAVTFNASNGYAPVQITPSVSAPSNGLSAGQLCTVNNILYQYNGSKWLSVSQEGVSFAARFGCGNYLTSDIQGAAGTGFTAIQKGTILGLTGSVGWGAMNKNFSIMKNGVFAPIQAFSMAAGKIMNSNLNIDFDAGDIIQIYFEANAQAFSPRIELTIAWRL